MDLLRYNSLPRMADWIVDYDKSYYDAAGVDITYTKPVGIDVDKMACNDTIFVKIDLLDQVMESLRQIPFSWHLITGNGDLSPSGHAMNMLANLPQMRSWSGHNLQKFSEKFFQIAIGFQELGPGRPNAPRGPFVIPKSKPIPVVVTPFGQTHGSRNSLQELHGPGILNLPDRLTYSDYLSVLGASRFSCCPRGNGWDTHRVLESIAMGAVPVVTQSPLDYMYQQLGCVVVEDWTECRDHNKFSYAQIDQKIITFDWWKTKLQQHQESMQ